MRIVAISGKIGSGKSIVSKVLRTMGFDVYDCDSNAKRIMNGSDTIKKSLKELFGHDIIKNESIDQSLLSQRVFNNPPMLQKLNQLVHGEVKNDILHKIKTSENELFFIETALLHTSGIIDFVNEVWWVEADNEIRKERVTKYRGMDSDDFECRDCRQENESRQDWFRIINNNPHMAILPQIERLIHNS